MENAVMETGGRRSVDAGRGVAWWSQAWALFMKNPGMWLVFGVIFFVGCVVLSLVPVIGGLIVALLAQVIVGGWVLSARKLESGGKLELPDLFAGFKDKVNPLLVLGALALGATVVILGVMAILGAGAVIGFGAGGSAGGLMTGAGLGVLAMLVGLALSFVFAMAFWFAPALVVLRNTAPIEALKQSWSATLANIAPFLVYGLLWIVAAVVASIPFGLGWLLLLPLTMLAIYCSYQDIFAQE
jgi:uncharacterized membrane protein